MGNGRGYLLLALGMLLAGPVGAQSADELLRQADRYYEEFTWDKALELYGEFSRKFPNDPRVPQAEYRALNATFRLEKIETIEEALTAFVEKYKGTTWAALGRQLLAQYLMRYRRWDNWERIGTLYAEAIREYRNAVGRRKFSPEELKTFVQMLFGAADFYGDWGNERARELAEEHLRSIIAYRLNDDSTARAWLLLGDLFRQRFNDKAKAEQAWLTIVRELPGADSADDALYRLAQLDLEAENYVRARARLMELRKRYPKSELEDDAEEQIRDIEAPLLHLQVSETHLPGAGIPTRLVTRNIKGVQFAAWRVDLFEIIAGGAAPRNLPELAKQGRKVFTWRQAVEDGGDYQFSRPKLDSPMREPGVYVIEAVAEGQPNLVQHALINITSLVLVQQYAERKLVSYVASRATLQPVDQVELLLLRPANEKYTTVAKGTTNADGLLTQIVPQRVENGDPRLMAIGRKGSEVVFQEDGLYTWWNEEQPRLEAYLYTDRPVYRPENTVHYRAILRRSHEGEFRNLPSIPVMVVIRSPRGEELRKETLTTDEYGTVAGELTLGADPRLGVYHVELRTPDNQTSGGSFRVEEYRKPEFEVTIGRPLAEVRPGGAAAVPLTAKYYFGAPVAEAEVKYVVQRRPYWHFVWWPGPWDWFYAGWRQPRHYWGADQVVAEGTAKTDAQGQAVIEFPTADDNDYTYTIEAEVADVTRRVVEASDSLTITRKAFFLTAHTNQGLYAPEDDVSVTIRAENADQQPIETPFSVMLWKMKWVPEVVDPKTREVTKAAHYERDVKVWNEERRLRTDPDSGERVVTFKAPADGYYQLAATAPDTFDPKAEITAQADFWVASDAWKGVNYNHANLQLVTEKDLYQKGDTARVLVNSPAPDGALLLTIGADAILTTRVMRLTGNSQVVEVPILDSYAPNVFINAVLVDTKQVYFANKELMVPPTDRLLNIKVESDREEFKPRTKGTFTITTDQNGKPVPAQVSIGISDESVYAIQEEMVQPIGAFFYGRKRWNQIRTSVSFEGYGEYDDEAGDRLEKARRGEAGAPAEAPRPAAPMAGARLEATAADSAAAPGGGAGGEAPITIREFFPDTILWQPAVVTGPDGKATVTVDFPDSLTTWRATARAVTKDTRVGQQVEKVVTTKDLIVRLQAPRFFTQLDESTVSMIVTNKTSNQQQVALNLQVDGLELVGDPAAAVVVAPNGQARVDRVVRAREAGEATMTVTARGPDDSDGLKLDFEVIPHGAEKFDTATGRVADDGKAAFALDLPAARREDATRLKVTVSPSLVTSLLDALPYLVQYPYGCVEQTTSRFLPAVMVARTLEYTGKPQPGGQPKQVPTWWESRGLEALPDMVGTGIKKLSSMQNADGGFGWFGGMRSDVWMSAYVTYGLLQARLADFAVDQEVLNRALRFLYGNLHLLKGQHDSTAYVAWVLTEAQASKLVQPDAAQRKEIEDAFQRVYANRDQLNDYTRALLVLGLVNRGERDKAEVAWRNLQAHRIETEHGVHWGKNRWGWRWSEDQVETTAYSLLAALAIEPKGDLALKAVNWLVLNRIGNHWYSTKDTAAAIFALARYADLHDELRSSYSARLTVNGREVKGWEVTPQNALSLDGAVEIDPTLLQSGENRLELTRDGKGNLYYSALLEYYTKEDPITAASSYISATRRYFKVTDYTDPQDNTRKTRRTELKNGDPIASGEQLEVEVTVEAENDFSYICLADPKPAGCEPVDQTSGGTWGGAWMYRELHDTEVTFFVDQLPQGKTTLTYRLRAETPGTFRALPHRGFSMYRPDVRALSDEGIVRVGERVES